jgi:gamma-glutamyltranspeptidase/glutathione hydrolase
MIGFHTGTSDRRAWQQRFPTYAEHGLVGAAHPLTVETGVAILRDGGNAVDAIVGAGLTAAVVMPEMCGLGGDLFAVLHHPTLGTFSLQGSGISPRNSSIEQMRAAGAEGKYMPDRGPLAISVPGMVDAYFALLERFGTKSFADVAQYAIAHARDGFLVHDLGAQHIADYADMLANDEAAASVFLPGGTPVGAGERLVQADLAQTIETLGRDGRDSFYSGDIAKRITSYLQAHGGALSVDDFSEHSSDIGAPIETTYRGHTVYQTAIPSQGLILLEALNIVENGSFGDLWTAEDIHLITEAKKLAYADRLAHTADANFHDSPLEKLLSKDWAKRRFAEIDPARAATRVDGGSLNDGDTTYINAIDGSGLMVSMIQSVSSAFGSGVIGGDTGVVLNNRVGRGFSLVEGHPNLYAPGKKTMHTLNAFMITDTENRPVLVGGTPGGDGQPQWNLQAIVGLIEGEFDVQAAIDLPRFTSWPGTDPGSIDNPFDLRIESRVGSEIISQLESLGHKVVVQGPWNGGGAMQMISRDPDTGVIIGGSDARVEGTVLGF